MEHRSGYLNETCIAEIASGRKSPPFRILISVDHDSTVAILNRVRTIIHWVFPAKRVLSKNFVFANKKAISAHKLSEYIM